MKKIFGIMLTAVLAMPVLAETDAKADYSDWLPKAGDWNVQVGMDPKALVMGGTWSNLGGFSAGYMVTDQLGVRATLGLSIDVWNHREYVADQAAQAQNALSKEKVIDKQRKESYGGTFSLGVDYHVGATKKVQGVFGVGLMYGVKALEKYTYTYGNAITEYNQKPLTSGEISLPDTKGDVWSKFTPTTIDESSPTYASGINDARVLRQYNSASNPRQMLGMYVSAGLEWFVTPKLALGLNVSMNLMYQFMSGYTTKYEGWSQIEHQVVEWTEMEKPKQDGFNFNTGDGIATQLYMSVYL